MEFVRPDMNIKCEEALMSFIRPAKTVLEWGSGGSTVMMSKQIEAGTIYSYEHDKRFYNWIKLELGNNVEYHLVSLVEYVSAPENRHYSVILVDGRKRNECLRRVRQEMSWETLLLHDADRERYKEEINKFSKYKYETSFVKNLWVCEHR